MRTRKQIEEAVDSRMGEKSIVEILLDIRQLLSELLVQGDEEE